MKGIHHICLACAFACALAMLLAGCAGVGGTQSSAAGSASGSISGSAAGALENAASQSQEEAASSAASQAVSTGTFEALSVQTSELGELRYWLYTPANPTENMPLIVYLHSATGKGDDLTLLTSIDGFPRYLAEGSLGDVRAYVAIPQLPAEQRGWANVGTSVCELTEAVLATYSIDRANVSLTGHSVGGTGSWNIAIARPDLFARIAPLSGGVRASKETLAALQDIPVWAFVGSVDDVIDPAMSARMVEALQNRGANAGLTVFEGAGHEDVPALAYLDESLDVVGWLIGATTQIGAQSDPSAVVSTRNGEGEGATTVGSNASASGSDGMNMYSNSTTIEKEQPELTDETKQAIASYHRDPSMENYLALRDIVIDNYDAVLARKEAKLAELKTETAGKDGGEAKVAEMEEIVQEMYLTYWNRINSSMLRFTDDRLLAWKVADAANYEFIPVMGAGDSIYIKRTPVTNADYAAFIEATGYKAPANWEGGSYPAGEADFPVNDVSSVDARAYCAWLTGQDGVNTYRLPTESEWELAAGHMPKDADFNCGVNNGRVSVNQYAGVTRGAHGAVDFWGNVWEWTSTERTEAGLATELGVKGGSWKSARTECRTEHRAESRAALGAYDDVGFRVVQVIGGVEPEQKAELYTLAAPEVSAKAGSDGSIALTWQPVEGAVEYQLFEYARDTGLFRMLGRTADASATIAAADVTPNSAYVVQALSYTGISDNVAPEYAAAA